MGYYFSKILNKSFSESRKHVEDHLKAAGFSIVSEIDLHDKFKEKLGIDFRPYKVLGACSPKHAYKTITAEEHIGLMLPCNVVIQQKATNLVEISIIDPIASMQAVQNPNLADTATEIRDLLKNVFESI